MTFAENLTATMKPLLKGMHDDGYSKGFIAGKKAGGIDTSDATASAAVIDYGQTAYVDGKKITGTKHRREYKGTIASEVKGSNAYATLATDNLLAEIRTLDTLFVRVEFDADKEKYTILKTWASNVNGEFIPAVGEQLVHRIDGSDPNGKTILTNLVKPIYDAPPAIGFVHITEAGELRIYSGSLNYAIRAVSYRVIVEW
jgi:hypothetical protein